MAKIVPDLTSESPITLSASWDMQKAEDYETVCKMGGCLSIRFNLRFQGIKHNHSDCWIEIGLRGGSLVLHLSQLIPDQYNPIKILNDSVTVTQKRSSKKSATIGVSDSKAEVGEENQEEYSSIFDQIETIVSNNRIEWFFSSQVNKELLKGSPKNLFIAAKMPSQSHKEPCAFAFDFLTNMSDWQGKIIRIPPTSFLKKIFLKAILHRFIRRLIEVYSQELSIKDGWTCKKICE